MSPLMPENPPLHLTKHHGAGNDFLVSIDMDDQAPLGSELVRALCDRRFGIGADGVIRILAGDGEADLTMELRNADGSVAEMSGNGMRCLAQAAVEAGLAKPPTFRVMTMAGMRSVEYRPAGGAGAAVASVDMGVPTLGPDQPERVAERRARQVNVGNPHLVLLGSDPSEADVADEGARLQEVHSGGINVEFIAIGPGTDAITLRVWERGVGETEACGTGSIAAAAAAHSWGLVSDTVDVHNPGGTLQVALAADGARLIGPVHKVADIDVIEAEVLGAARS
jgi:diaminopimelate epimerase